MGLDYRAIFARELHRLICEVFPAHGIDSLDEDYFDQMVRDLTKSYFWETVADLRREHPSLCPSTVSGMRFRW